jgi:hypothetical protein
MRAISFYSCVHILFTYKVITAGCHGYVTQTQRLTFLSTLRTAIVVLYEQPLHLRVELHTEEVLEKALSFVEPSSSQQPDARTYYGPAQSSSRPPTLLLHYFPTHEKEAYKMTSLPVCMPPPPITLAIVVNLGGVEVVGRSQRTVRGRQGLTNPYRRKQINTKRS